MNAEERIRIEKWMEEHPEEAKEITRCDDCHRPFVAGETVYAVTDDPAGFRDETTIEKLVCDECYSRYYGWNHLRTRVIVE